MSAEQEQQQRTIEVDMEAQDDQMIDDLQAQIEERKKNGSGWTFDPDSWKTHPAFMNEITEKDVLENEACAALSAMVHDGLTDEEHAELKKTSGNDAMKRALDPEQVNRANWARSAARSYTDGLEVGCKSQTLNAQLYCNRSMANFVMENFGKGLADAQRAILIDPKYTKAYNRGAKCAQRIRKWEIAKSLIASGLELVDAKEVTTKKDFEDLLAGVKKAEEAEATAAKNAKLKNRAAAAKSNNLLKEITSKGIKISPRAEVTSEQWAQTGNKKPYFDKEGILHFPLLLMYDEVQTTDFLQDIPCDVSMAEVLEGEVMPFPWDQGRGRYATLNDFVCVFIVDDGVKMPKYYEIDMSWTFFEVMRQPEYIMPGLVPTFHIVAKGSEILKQWGISK